VRDVAYTVAVSFERAIARQLGARRFAEFKKALVEVNEHIANGDLVIASVVKANPASGAARPQRRSAKAAGSSL
jgi:hypothetical protein